MFRNRTTCRTAVAGTRTAGGSVKLLPIGFSMALAATLTACGGASNPPVAEPRGLPLQTAVHAHQAPVVELDGRLHVGTDVIAPAGDLPVVAVHGDASVSHGTIRDGVGAAEAIAYLRADAAWYGSPDGSEESDAQPLSDGLVLRFAASPPTVRVAEGTPAELIDETVRVVQAINGALPRGVAAAVRHRTRTCRRAGPRGRANSGLLRGASGSGPAMPFRRPARISGSRSRDTRSSPRATRRSR